MPKSSNSEKYFQLRKEHPFFTYEGFDYRFSKEGLQIQFHFNLSDKVAFHPRMVLPARDFYRWEDMEKGTIDSFVFSIGMVELVSYWKTVCPPVVRIRNHYLDHEQITWWKKLYFHGLGEFFYLNSIDAGMEDFMEIQCDEGGANYSPIRLQLDEKSIVPIGGGKDSVVTLELLSETEPPLPFIMNPRQASLGCALVKGYDEPSIIRIDRYIDPELLILNAKGYLNGHTPFSALLAFTTALTAVLTRRKYIALSNESSANESTVSDTMVNHQYSKSFEFEKDFRWYLHRYLSPDIEYFSFLRPINELQIARLFSGFRAYHGVFKSCNVGSKTDSWCGHCPKCLFTWIILSPFLSQQELLAIFGTNLLQNHALRPTLDELMGHAATKPFECIGTVDEVNAALGYISDSLNEVDIPSLIRYYRDSNAHSKQTGSSLPALLSAFETEHFLPTQFEVVLKSALHD
jgi:hypothetical protein